MSASNVINLAAWVAKRKKSHWRTMSEITHHRTLSPEEMLEYVAFAVWYRELEARKFDGKITCELNEDGSVEVYAVETVQDNEEGESNSSLN